MTETEQLLEQWTPLIWKVIRKTFIPPESIVDWDDLFQVGQIALLKAIRDWDRRYALMTLAYPRIQRAIWREVDNAKWSKTTEKKNLRKDRMLVSDEILYDSDYGFQENGYEITDMNLAIDTIKDERTRLILRKLIDGDTLTEIAEKLGITRQRVAQLRDEGWRVLNAS